MGRAVGAIALTIVDLFFLASFLFWFMYTETHKAIEQDIHGHGLLELVNTGARN